MPFLVVNKLYKPQGHLLGDSQTASQNIFFTVRTAYRNRSDGDGSINIDESKGEAEK
jgi:hypothetical protein